MAQYRIHFVFIDPSPTGHHSWVHPLFWYCFNHLGYRIITMMWRFCVQGSVFLPVCHLDILRGNAWQSLDVSRWNKTSSSSTRIFFFPLINRKDKFKRMIMHSFSECLWYFFFGLFYSIWVSQPPCCSLPPLQWIHLYHVNAAFTRTLTASLRPLFLWWSQV